MLRAKEHAMMTWRWGAAVLLTLALLVPTAALGYPRDDASLVEVEIHSRADIHRLNELGADILNVRDGVAEVAATPGEVDVLWANGFRPRVVLEDMRDAVQSLNLPGRGEYHSYTELTDDMAAWAAAYPSITELISIGQSYQGREIWALKITDNPTVEEFEPEIQWIGGHHGNETIGVEVPYYMADFLLRGYGMNPQVTWLVDNREIWLIPMLNPDGHVAGSRYNAQGTDLNRNYLCPCGCNAGTAFSAPETRALRDFNVGMNPVTSLTFHSGAVYVNYLWDYTYDPTPDEPMLITISNGYSSYTGYPVTNGADWYIVHGSCQDWCYDTRGEIDTTIELSNSYEPPASQIDPICEANRNAMLYQARMSGRGIRGVVTDGETGDPLYATISIPEIGKDVYTDPAVGDYHRMVESGTYTVECSVAGYPTQTVYNVTASLDTFVVINFAMEPPDRGTIAGYVTDDDMSPLEATVELLDLAGYETVSDPVTGYYEILHIPVGLHDVQASATGYQTVVREGVLVEDNTTSSEDFVLASPAFYDGFELGVGEWTGSWSLTTEHSHSPTHSLTESPGGDYGNNDYEVATLASAIDLSASESAELSFWHRYDTEANYDFCYVEVSGDGGSNWDRVASYDGYLGDWTQVRIDLADYLDSTAFKVRFVFDSDGWVTADGWYLDDVAIFATSDSSNIDEAIVSRLFVRNHPNPFNPKTSIRYDVPVRGNVNLAVYDVTGRLVRTIIEGDPHGPGTYGRPWDGKNERGQDVAGGVYFARVEVAGETASAKMVLLK
jgi:hypothetical protein